MYPISVTILTDISIFEIPFYRFANIFVIDKRTTATRPFHLTDCGANCARLMNRNDTNIRYDTYKNHFEIRISDTGVFFTFIT